MQLDGFNSVIKHQLSFNKLIETKVTQLVSSCLNHDMGKLSGQSEVTPKESMTAVAVRARQSAQQTHLPQDAGTPSCLNHDTGKLSGQPEVTPKESVNAVAVRARQSTQKPHLPQDASTLWKTVTARNIDAEDGVL
jgi:predicted HD phosphohydrolase